MSQNAKSYLQNATSLGAAHAGGAVCACQALVQESVAVLTRPQAGRDAQKSAIAAAQSEPLPEGRMPDPEPVVADEDESEAETESDEL